MEKIEEYCVRVKSIEEGETEDKLRVNFVFDKGVYSLELDVDKYKRFIPGMEYIGVFKVSGFPDFIGEKEEWENICTANYSLEKLLSENKVAWEK